MKALQINHLSKKYASGTFALNDINFSVEEGAFVGLLGPNGAGKSTLIGILSSLVQKTSGEVEIFNYNIDKNFNAAKAFLGVVPQEFNFVLFDTVQEVVINQAGFYGLSYDVALARSENYLKLLGLWEKRHTAIHRLSGGMKRRLMIVCALIHEPKLLILDEPTAGVDVELRRFIWDFLKDLNKKEGKTIILTTHYLEEAEMLCDRVAIINGGQLVANELTQTLIEQLPSECFLLTLAQPLKKTPIILDYDLRLIDSLTLEVNILRNQRINDLFHELTTQNIFVIGLRNKVNRLEELFLRLTKLS